MTQQSEFDVHCLIEFTVTNYRTFGWKSVNFLVGHILSLLGLIHKAVV